MISEASVSDGQFPCFWAVVKETIMVGGGMQWIKQLT